MKKFLKISMMLLLCAAMLLSVFGCGKQEEAEEAKESVEENQNALQEHIEEIIEENSDQEVEEYVMPAESCFVWDSVEGGVTITEYTGKDKAVIVPETLGGENVVGIATGAFNAAEIVGIKLPGKLIELGENAFAFCTTLQEVYFGEATESISTDAFDGCVVLHTVVFNNALKYIGQRAFANCQSLKSVVLPEGLEEIGSGAFLMTGIEELIIPGSVKQVGNQAFTSCDSLKTVEIKEGVEILGEQVFEACPELKEVKIPASVTEIGIWCFDQYENAVVVIIAPAGSVAEAYAIDNEHTYKAS